MLKARLRRRFSLLGWGFGRLVSDIGGTVGAPKRLGNLNKSFVIMSEKMLKAVPAVFLFCAHE